MRFRFALLPVLVLSVLGLSACGDSGGGPSAEGLVELAPSGSAFYAEATIQPDAERGDAIDALAGKLAGEDDLGALIISELESSAADSGVELDFARDIEPWLGESAAIAVPEVAVEASSEVSTDCVPPIDAADAPADGECAIEGSSGTDSPALVLIETTDAGAAQEFLDKVAEESDKDNERTDASYEGVDYTVSSDAATGLIDDTLVVGTDEEVFKRAVDTSGGDSLAGSGTYNDAIEQLEADKPAFVYVDTGGIFEAAIASSEVAGEDQSQVDIARDLFGDLLETPYVASFDVTDESVVVDYAGPSSSYGGGGGKLLGDAPAGSVAGFGFVDVGGNLSDLLDRLRDVEVEGLGSLDSAISIGEAQLGLDIENDLLAWMGDAALFVSATNPNDVAVGFVIETTDSQKSAATLEQISGLSNLTGASIGPAPAGADAGLSIQQPGTSIQVAQFDDKVIVAGAETESSAATLLKSIASGGEDPIEGNPLDSQFEPSGYLDFPSLVGILDASDARTDPGYKQARPTLEALGQLVFGADPNESGRGQSVLTVP